MERKVIRLHPVGLLEYSGFEPRGGCLPVIKGHQYEVRRDMTVSGDAPKDFVRIYEHGHGRKANSHTWPMYIAKVGHKHYPMESVTEHLLNRFGEVLGMRMAASRLVRVGGQVRFMSRYFLSDPHNQELVHGANIYSGYLNNDHGMVEAIEQEGLSRDFFTVQFTHDALRFMFPVQADDIFHAFLRMLVFDAYVGNNDRHFYNWGVIRNISDKECPRFSPIYDTARGLFWNDHEDKLQDRLAHPKQVPAFVKKYCEGSGPKIGCDGKKVLNHFELIAEIKRIMPETLLAEMRTLVSPEGLKNLLNLVDLEFRGLLGPNRAYLVKECLAYRAERLANLL